MFVHNRQSFSMEMLLNVEVCPWSWTSRVNCQEDMECAMRVDGNSVQWESALSHHEQRFKPFVQKPCALSKVPHPWSCSQAMATPVQTSLGARVLTPCTQRVRLEGNSRWCPKERLAAVPTTDMPNSFHKENKNNGNILVAYAIDSNKELAASSLSRSKISEPEDHVAHLHSHFTGDERQLSVGWEWRVWAHKDFPQASDATSWSHSWINH